MDEMSVALDPPRLVKARRTKRPTHVPRRSSPVWPLPALNGREPVVIGTHRNGVELGYMDPVAGTHIVPEMAAVLAIDDGVITFAGPHGHAFAAIIDHGNGTASYYANLSRLRAVPTDARRDQRVRAGSVIGYVGAPLYLELWKAERNRLFVPVDPRERLRASNLVHHGDQHTPSPSTAQQEAA